MNVLERYIINYLLATVTAMLLGIRRSTTYTPKEFFSTAKLIGIYVLQFHGYFRICILMQFHKNDQNRHFELGLQNFRFRYWYIRVGPRFEFLIHIMFGMKKHNLVSRLAGGGIFHSTPAGFDQIYVVYLS